MEQDLDAAMLDLGRHCSEASCHQLDFLPFSCSHCRATFCSEHWKVDAHRCPDVSKADNRIDVPACPLCSKPIPVERDEDPNMPMDRHFTSSCPVLDPRNGLARPAVKARDPNLCASPRCKTRLVAVRITCPTCRNDFCAAHRMPRDHACAPPAPIAAPKKPSAGTAPITKRLSAKLAAKAASTPNSQPGLAALRRAKVAASERLQASGHTKEDAIDLDEEGMAPSRPKPSPLSAAGRRAAQERKLAIKSLEGRAAKGLLSDDQKLELAMLSAKGKREGSLTDSKKDCTVS